MTVDYEDDYDEDYMSPPPFKANNYSNICNTSNSICMHDMGLKKRIINFLNI